MLYCIVLYIFVATIISLYKIHSTLPRSSSRHSTAPPVILYASVYVCAHLSHFIFLHIFATDNSFVALGSVTRTLHIVLGFFVSPERLALGPPFQISGKGKGGCPRARLEPLLRDSLALLATMLIHWATVHHTCDHRRHRSRSRKAHLLVLRLMLS